MDAVDVELDRLQRALGEPAVIETGRCISTPTGGAAPGVNQRWVNVVGGAELLPLSIDAWSVGVGDTVIIARSPLAGGLIIGAVAAASRRLPGEGTVTAASGGNVTVAVGTASYTGRFLTSYVPTIGDKVNMKWDADAGLVILGDYGTVAPPVPPPPPPLPPVQAPAAPPPPATGTARFPAVDSVSWRGGKWRTDSNVVAQSDWGGWGDNNGAWFYGSGPTDQLAGATITRCQIRIHRQPGGVWGGQTVHLYRHTDRNRPGGDVSRVQGPWDASVAIDEAIWVDLPADAGQAIVDSGGGVGITGAPYVVLYPAGSDPESGLLSMDWRRP